MVFGIYIFMKRQKKDQTKWMWQTIWQGTAVFFFLFCFSFFSAGYYLWTSNIESKEYIIASSWNERDRKTVTTTHMYITRIEYGMRWRVKWTFFQRETVLFNADRYVYPYASDCVGQFIVFYLRSYNLGIFSLDPCSVWFV